MITKLTFSLKTIALQYIHIKKDVLLWKVSVELMDCVIMEGGSPVHSEDIIRYN